MTWANASAACTEGGGSLATIHTAVKDDDVHAFMQALPADAWADTCYSQADPWIGGRNCTSSGCTWVDGSTWNYVER